jgi:hypothetical protein
MPSLPSEHDALDTLTKEAGDNFRPEESQKVTSLIAGYRHVRSNYDLQWRVYPAPQ